MTACSRPAPPQEPVRAVKLMTVGGGAGVAAGICRRGARQGGVPPGFRVGGKIVQRQAELGQRVKAGDVLAQLD